MTTDDSYRYTDKDGAGFVVYPVLRDDAEGALMVWDHEHDGALIASDRLAEITAELYKAAGKPAPIILEPINWMGNDRSVYSFNGVRVEREAKRITLLNKRITATTARGLARILAEMADDADAEPDPRELEQLTAFLDDVMDTDPDTLARKVLRRFKVEERAS